VTLLQVEDGSHVVRYRTFPCGDSQVRTLPHQGRTAAKRGGLAAWKTTSMRKHAKIMKSEALESEELGSERRRSTIEVCAAEVYDAHLRTWEYAGGESRDRDDITRSQSALDGLSHVPL
jgi:hypothetical protein